MKNNLIADFETSDPCLNSKNNNENKQKINHSSDFSNSSNSNNNQKQIGLDEKNIFDDKKLMGVFELLSLSYKIFKERWKKFLGLFLLLIVISAISEAADYSLGLFKNSFLFFVLEIIMLVIFSILGMLIEISIIKIVKDKYLGIIDSIRMSFNKIIPFFITILIGIVVMFSVGLFIMALIFGGFILLDGINSYLSLEIITSILNVLMFIFGFSCIILMLLFILIAHFWISFAEFAVIVDGRSPIEALSCSYELLKGKMFAIIKKAIGLMLIFLLAYFILIVPVFILPLLGIVIFPLILAFAFISPFLITIFFYSIYCNLKAIKKDNLSQDYTMNYQGKIKAFFAAGVVFIIIIFSVLVFSPSTFNKYLGTEFFMNLKDNFQDRKNTKEHEKVDIITVKGRDSRRISDLNLISTMLWNYKKQNRNYPVSVLVAKLDEDNEIVRKIKSTNNKDIPIDPKKDYYYGYKSDGKTYELSAVLENKEDSRCKIEGNFCIYKIRKIKVVQSEKELAAIIEDFSSPEATFNIFLKSFAEGNIDLNFKCLTTESKKQLEKDSRIFDNFKKGDWGYVPERELKAKYDIIERTEKYAIMAPDLREQKMDDGTIILMPDFYFKIEESYWRIDYITTIFLDTKIRNFIPDLEARKKNLNEMKEKWKKQF